MVIVFGRFSARTNLALAVALRLHAELERRKITAPSKLADIISIYSRVNYAQSRGDGSGPWVRQKAGFREKESQTERNIRGSSWDMNKIQCEH